MGSAFLKKSKKNEWIVKSRSDKKKKYTVKLNGGIWSCSCPSYIYRNSYEYDRKLRKKVPVCKHIKFIREEAKEELKPKLFLVNL